ncbi:MAG: hypothetical protein O7F09_00405 [Chloroflexi bacterium]|nr:hypothetical protein [Chloroflexota bacterium]
MACLTTATLLAVACAGDPTPTPAQEPVSLDGSPQTPWVRDRILAIEGLYRFTEAGEAWLEGYDLRQMEGQPGWFGSFGYQRWAGVGQAIPDRVLHELSHSYYGAFTITGRPELSWETPEGDEVSPALLQYRADLATFMSQPPDAYEALRERFRNLPNLSKGQYPDLHHFGEADLIFAVGGNLNLIPPILVKYFDQFLLSGEIQTWNETLRWYLGLSDGNTRIADGQIGIAHFPRTGYEAMEPLSAADVPQQFRAILEGEERQRLSDFAQQYDLIKRERFSLTDAASVDGDFKFWRRLLREVLELHRKHPDVLAQAGGQGINIASVLDTLLEAERLSPQEQARLLRPRLQEPLVSDFLALLHSRALVDLLAREPQEASDAPVQDVIGKFTEKLRHFIEAVDSVTTTGRDDPDRGVRELEEFLAGLGDDEQRRNLDLILDLLWEVDPELAGELVNGMSDAAILQILNNNPGATMNGHVRPQRLLTALNITIDASQEQLTDGMRSLLGNTSGNAQIDAPFTGLAYDVVAQRATQAPRETMAVLQEAQVRLSAQPFTGFIASRPLAASAILSADLDGAAELIASRQGHGETPQRVIHTLILHDPVLAGKIVATLSARGEEEIVAEALIIFASDSRRLEANRSADLSLENDRRFLQHLIDAKGAAWVRQRMESAIRTYDRHIRNGTMDPGFLTAYAETLQRIIDLETEPSRRRVLEETFDGAFEATTGGALSAY